MTALRRIRLTEYEDGTWKARDLDAGIAAEGPTRTDALNELDAVVATLEDPGEYDPSDAELRGRGIDPETREPAHESQSSGSESTSDD